ncbi:MAG: TetR/AcrR family transcriptional regulator [Bryobacteraceae bacterium]|nr:TetR/AcrR family transcriptional regulator [Bryobacteraceae bacterium]
MAPGLREQRREFTRSQILSAAVDLLAERGPTELTIRNLAARVNYSPMALYAYFPAKSDLLTAVTAVIAEQFEKTLAQAGPRLETAAAAWVRFACDDPKRYRLLFAPGAAGSHATAERVLGALVSARIPEARRTEAKVQRVTLAVWAGLHGLATLMTDAPDVPFAQTGVADALIPAMLRGFLLD